MGGFLFCKLYFIYALPCFTPPISVQTDSIYESARVIWQIRQEVIKRLFMTR